MNRRRIPLVLALVAVVALFLSYGLLPLTKNSQAAPAPSSDAAFKGKVLAVTTSNIMSTFVLEKAQIQKIGDRSFLVGKGVDLDGGNIGPFKGRTVRVQMEHVVSITEFDNLQDFEKAGTVIRVGHAPVRAGTPVPASGPIQQGEAIKLIPPEKKK